MPAQPLTRPTWPRRPRPAPRGEPPRPARPPPAPPAAPPPPSGAALRRRGSGTGGRVGGWVAGLGHGVLVAALAALAGAPGAPLLLPCAPPPVKNFASQPHFHLKKEEMFLFSSFNENFINIQFAPHRPAPPRRPPARRRRPAACPAPPHRGVMSPTRPPARPPACRCLPGSARRTDPGRRAPPPGCGVRVGWWVGGRMDGGAGRLRAARDGRQAAVAGLNCAACALQGGGLVRCHLPARPPSPGAPPTHPPARVQQVQDHAVAGAELQSGMGRGAGRRGAGQARVTPWSRQQWGRWCIPEPQQAAGGQGRQRQPPPPPPPQQQQQRRRRQQQQQQQQRRRQQQQQRRRQQQQQQQQQQRRRQQQHPARQQPARQQPARRARAWERSGSGPLRMMSHATSASSHLDCGG